MYTYVQLAALPLFRPARTVVGESRLSRVRLHRKQLSTNYLTANGCLTVCPA